MDFHLTRDKLKLDRFRALVRELRNPFQGGLQLVAPQCDMMRVFLRQHPFIIWEVSGQLAAKQQAFFDFEKEVILVPCEVNLLIRTAIARELQYFQHRLLWQESLERRL